MTPRAEQVLRGTSLARFLPAEHYARLCEHFQEVRYDFGETIIRQGDEADAFFVLISGRARVILEQPNGHEVTLQRLQPGDEFGETSLLEGGRRKSSVRCSTAVEVLRLGRQEFQELVATHGALLESFELLARWRALHGFLYSYSNFGRLPAPALRALMERLKSRGVRKGEVVIREGEPAGPVYIVRSGRLRVFRGPPGQPQPIGFLREGDYFGELSILTGSPRAATVEAVTDGELLALGLEAVGELQQLFPEFHRLLEERRALYRADVPARVPLDFQTELLPATPGQVPDRMPASPEDGEPFADEQGRFRHRERGSVRVPFVAQIDEMDCGAACLAMVCRHFGRRVSLVRIRELCHVSSDGTSLDGLCAAATGLGLAARGVKASRRNLDQMPLPAIAHWEGRHWVVITGVAPDRVSVMDPASGPRRYSRADFEQKWTGYAALFDYTEAFEQAPESGPAVAWAWPFFRRYRTVFLQTFLLAVVVSGLQLLLPVATQVVVDQVMVERNVGLLHQMLLAMGGALVFLILANLLQQYLLSFAAVRIDGAILDFLTRRLLDLPMSYFHSRRTGDIQRRLDGAREIRQFVVYQGIGSLLAVVQFAGCSALMALYSLPLAGLFAATLPLYGALMWFSRRVLRPVFRDIEERQARYASFQIDAIKGIEAVKASAAEPAFREALLRQFLTMSGGLLRGSFFMMFYQNAIQAVGLVTGGLFLWVGALLVIRGDLSVGRFVAFNSLLAMASVALLRALGVWDSLQVVGVLLNRLNDIFESEPEQGRDRSHLKPVASLAGQVELRNLGFRYGGPESPRILHDIDLQVAPGKTVAIVGRSGSGKTTLIKLLAGLLEPSEGSILYDNVELKLLNYRDLRRHVGMVLQENHIFDDTILNNIAFGDREPNFERVLRAAQLANAHEFIARLPLGYETRIGETGVALSGGQRQRIAIARALYHDPPVLIFDEATSALDTESERAIQDNLRHLLHGRTCFIIAHRLSTVRDADLIVVLERGRVVESGTHDELIAARGLYFHLSRQQLSL